MLLCWHIWPDLMNTIHFPYISLYTVHLFILHAIYLYMITQFMFSVKGIMFWLFGWFVSRITPKNLLSPIHRLQTFTKLGQRMGQHYLLVQIWIKPLLLCFLVNNRWMDLDERNPPYLGFCYHCVRRKGDCWALEVVCTLLSAILAAYETSNCKNKTTTKKIFTSLFCLFCI